ncbi:hypothetical protein SHKM778_68300 [Streptomyces sp. KM77-8]|uniref:Uncharacterized protein n=1 Tax=Streptomyces haneummycinicus TaxID=3074435 RepID=A0AAT9HSV9_9ACTN
MAQGREPGAETVGEGQVVGADRVHADFRDEFEEARSAVYSNRAGLESNRRAERASSVTGP